MSTQAQRIVEWANSNQFNYETAAQYMCGEDVIETVLGTSEGANQVSHEHLDSGRWSEQIEEVWELEDESLVILRFDHGLTEYQDSDGLYEVAEGIGVETVVTVYKQQGMSAAL